MGHDTETDKLIVDYENILSPVESETELHTHVYLWVGDHASVHFERQVEKKGQGHHQYGPNLMNAGPQNVPPSKLTKKMYWSL